MLRQFYTITVISLSCVLSACHVMYRQDVSQGNLISQYQASQIKPGMSIATVVNRLGAPVLKNIYPSQRLIYAYSLKPGYGDLKTQRVIVQFKGGKVSSVKFSA